MPFDKQSKIELEQAIQTLANRPVTQSEFDAILKYVVPQNWPKITDKQDVSEYDAKEHLNETAATWLMGTCSVLYLIVYFLG